MLPLPGESAGNGMTMASAIPAHFCRIHDPMRFRDALSRALDVPLPQGGRVAVDLANGETVFLQITSAAEFEAPLSYAVVRTSWPSFDFVVEEAGPAAWQIRTASLEISLALEPFHFRVTDQYGTIRFETAETGLEFRGEEIHLARKLEPGEAVYGLGEHGENFNRHPGRYRIWNRDEPIAHAYKQYYCTIPVGICAPGGALGPHAFFLDNPGELIFEVGLKTPGVFRMETRTGDLRLWLFFEDTPARLIEEYTALTGRMERPPLWALGFQQCRWSYMSADRIREIAHEYRTRQLPCDVVYLDIDYMEKYRVFTWNTETFPEPEQLLSDLRNDGFRAICIVDPGVAVAPGYEPYEVGMQTPGFFLCDAKGVPLVEKVWPGEVHMPDFTLPQTQYLWGQWQGKALLDKGIAGIWNDMNEPAVFSDKCFTHDFPSDAVHHDFGLFRAHHRVHNVYGFTMAQASYEGQRHHRPHLRPFCLTRSGWAGVQRYSAVWTGDNVSSYASMVMDVQLNLSMGLSGVSFVGCDIGGFQNNASPELFARWMEWGVFQPFARTHSAAGTADHEPWAHGPLAERVAKRLLELRYQLLPYLYTQFVEACETGLPVNRPLALEYPQDATVASLGDQFLLGPDVMVAPILQTGGTHRQVYLPAGEWIHFWTERRLEGGRWIMAESPLGQPPLYIRAGAIIPMHPIRQSTAEPDPDVVFLDVWPAARMSGRLVEDDGETRAYQDGQESRVIFSGEETAKGLNLLIGAPQGPYRSGRRRWIVRLHDHRRAVASVTCQGREIPFEQSTNLTTWELMDEMKSLDVDVVFSD